MLEYVLKLIKGNADVINALAQSFAALGTFLAVLVALYLSRKESKIKLTPYNTVMFLYQMPTLNPVGKKVSITITNTGFRRTVVSHVFWSYGFINKKTFNQFFVPGHGDDALPKPLEHGDTATISIPLEAFIKENIPGFLSVSGTWLLPLKTHFMKVCVCTTTGQVFSCKICKQLREYVVLK